MKINVSLGLLLFVDRVKTKFPMLAFLHNGEIVKNSIVAESRIANCERELIASILKE